MTPFRSRLETAISARHLLSHSFYVRWQNGELSHEELRGYAMEYYAFEKEFPRFLSAIHSRCDDDSVRKMLLENLCHEEQGEKNHPALWLDFAEGVGATRDDVKNHSPSPETDNLLRLFRRHSQSTALADGVAALFAYESQQPSVATQKIDGLQKRYGIADATTLAFFRAHQTYDVAHSDTEAQILEQVCESENAKQRACSVVEETAAALHTFLDGVERRFRPT